ncbi:hypothetical protein ACHAP5_010568 [Fusarium lateritium]
MASITKQKCSETYWPLLKEQLASGKVGFDDLDLQCTICYDTMGVQSCELVPDESGHDHGAVILPCGHMFGYSCFRQAVQTSEANGMNVCCPSCRAAVTHMGCGHISLGQMIPTRQEDLDRVALAVKDCNINHICKHCYGDLYLKQLRQLLRSMPRHRAIDSGLELVLATRNHMYIQGGPAPEFSEEIPLPEIVAAMFRLYMTGHKLIEEGKSPGAGPNEGVWCDEPLSDSVLRCYITGPPPPKPLPFWEYVDYQNLQALRDGVEPKSIEELRAAYDDESYWGWLC